MRAWMVGVCVVLATVCVVSAAEPGQVWTEATKRERAMWYRGWYDGITSATVSMVDGTDAAGLKIAGETADDLLGRVDPNAVLRMMDQIYEDAANACITWPAAAIGGLRILQGESREAVLRDARAAAHRARQPD